MERSPLATYIHIYVKQIMKNIKEIMNLKAKGVHKKDGLEGGKRRGKLCKYNLKNKQ